LKGWRSRFSVPARAEHENQKPQLPGRRRLAAAGEMGAKKFACRPEGMENHRHFITT